MIMSLALPPNKWYYLFLGLALAVNFSGLFVPLMNPDATLYATIAKTMVLRNDYVNIYVGDADWLDKPHFPFWVAAAFFKIFGINNWAYKLSGIVFMLMGAAYTWLFAKRLYGTGVAMWALLILLTAQHIVLSDNDVRAEPYLTGLVIAAVYHFYRSYTKPGFWHLLAACLFTACAIMTKGIFVLVTIGGAIGGHLIITKQWKQVFNLRWVQAVLLIGLLILPEIYCLYTQFDDHPEKVVFGQHSVSGIRFFFWDSQFGRFFNTGPIKNGTGDPFFFIHTTLWAFLPWSLLLFIAIYQFIKDGIKSVKRTEWHTLSGALLTFVMFSASKFQLPHYINIIFPFFSILTAQYIFTVKSVKSIRAINITQWIVIVLLFTILIVLHNFYRPDAQMLLIAIGVPVLMLALLLLPGQFGKNWYERVGFRCIIACAMVNFYLNWVFYPDVLKYQAGSEAGMYINLQDYPAGLPVLQSGDDYNFALEFYLDRPMVNIPADGSAKLPKGQFLLYAPADMINNITHNQPVRTLKTFERYAITRLKPGFLNKVTRNSELTIMKLVIVDPAYKTTTSTSLPKKL
jgi:4-amino-4-deoxy-L-arabinose transferase-like glycosyltransferase